jgi:CRP-like cAMP-binding protein
MHVRSSSVPPALPGSLGTVRNGDISPIPAAVSYRPGSLAQRTEIAFPGAARAQQPSAPSLTRERNSVVPHSVPPNPFAPATAARADFQHSALRAPMGSSPDLEVNEVDLDEAGLDLISLGPGSLRGSQRPSGFMGQDADRMITELESASLRASSLPPSQDLSHLYADEEVVEDGERDRLSDLTLDTFDFSAKQGERNPSGPPSLRSSQLPPPLDEVGVTSAPAWVTPTRAAGSDAPPLLSSRSSAPPSLNAASRTTPPPAPVRGKRSSAAPPAVGPDSVPPSQEPAKSKPPVLVRKSSGSPVASGRSSSVPPSRQERNTARPAASAPPPEPWAPGARANAPGRMSTNPPPSSISSLPTLMPTANTQRTSAASPALSARVDGVELAEARGFEDLPKEVQVLLAASARIETLHEGEEVAFFGAAVVTHGAVDILPAISDEAGAVAHQGEVVFTIGTLPDAMPLRVVAKLETRVAVWDRQTFNDAIAECPWVHDDLHQIADRFLACCGATLGALGERLDDALRGAVYSRFDVATYNADEVLVSAGETVPKLFVVGGGKLELVDAAGHIVDELGPGDFLFPSNILSAGKAPHTARAGAGGALVLQASRAAAHELFMSVPPLLEILAG